jgi:transposase
MERGEIASYEQARKFLADQGVHYRNQSSIFRLFKRHRIKAKTGRPRHQKADPQEQEAFKKTSPANSES